MTFIPLWFKIIVLCPCINYSNFTAILGCVHTDGKCWAYQFGKAKCWQIHLLWPCSFYVHLSRYLTRFWMHQSPWNAATFVVLKYCCKV
ncbi:hypothetical protein Hdeb2414_s0013g00411511 [Helianthus debilis subsp. tardiflorus]